MSWPELAQLAIQIGEGSLQQLTVVRIGRRLELLKNSLPRQPEILFVPGELSLLPAHLRTRLGCLTCRLGLLSFDGFTLPASSHILIIAV